MRPGQGANRNYAQKKSRRKYLTTSKYVDSLDKIEEYYKDQTDKNSEQTILILTYKKPKM